MGRRVIEQIHEIELSSRCNLACVYCPSPTLQRAKLDMTQETYTRALAHVAHYCARGTQSELALTGVGEALLHEQFVPMLLAARSVIGPERDLTFSTNGLLLTAEIIAAIEPANPIVFISLHRPEAAGPAIAAIRKSRLRHGTNGSFVTSALNWTGQVQWHVSHAPQVCAYLRDGWAVIRADGTVGSCCWDAESVDGRLGSVQDPLGSFTTAPHAACSRCSLSVPLELRAAMKTFQESCLT